jgi:hypothetical protein
MGEPTAISRWCSLGGGGESRQRSELDEMLRQHSTSGEYLGVKQGRGTLGRAEMGPREEGTSPVMENQLFPRA